jgi:hypothetical protein
LKWLDIKKREEIIEMEDSRMCTLHETIVMFLESKKPPIPLFSILSLCFKSTHSLSLSNNQIIYIENKVEREKEKNEREVILC